MIDRVLPLVFLEQLIGYCVGQGRVWPHYVSGGYSACNTNKVKPYGIAGRADKIAFPMSTSFSASLGFESSSSPSELTTPLSGWRLSDGESGIAESFTASASGPLSSTTA